MVDITLSIPDDLKKEMEEFPEINWSVVIRSSIKQKLFDLKFLKSFTSESDITDEDAEKLGREVSDLLAKHYMSK
ncbi:MAG: hypothetical protein EU547_07190 [Promethearchaeota archaeon]|nr:MAG: hypothetical protein EU547_07190 [Candidatus Lokiarchaeota archaeon]